MYVTGVVRGALSVYHGSMAFFTKPLSITTETVERGNPPSPSSELAERRRKAKAEFDEAFRNRIAYERANALLDSVRLIGDKACAAVGAMKQYPEYARLCFIEATAKRRWTELTKQETRLKFPGLEL